MRCVNDGILLKEFCELDLPNIENWFEKDSNNNKLLIHELISKYYNYIKFKSQQLRTSFSLTLYKKEKYLHFSQLSVGQTQNEINLILQFVDKAFEVIETKRNGHLKYKLCQYVFLMILNDLFKYYSCSLVAFNVLIKRIDQLQLEDLLQMAEITRLLYKFCNQFDTFINQNKFIAGFEYFDVEYKITPDLVELIVQYMNLYEQAQKGTPSQSKEIHFNTQKSIQVLAKIISQSPFKTQSQESFMGQGNAEQQYSKSVMYCNQFKHKFDEIKFQEFQNNFSSNYITIPEYYKQNKAIPEFKEEDEELDILAKIEEYKMKLQCDQQIHLLYPEAFNEKKFLNFENIYYQ
ncbi:unnamed protein product (macronuclear) [Paramecium tetraurelia]|uniref:AP180 N-terminal homology (ANTH) domain-containing protein n=1 Tax=Paramecium tetraurelia TaxID=5888 RepID=A0CM25_PARTE|nr:uncharacterized protein GSPATT00008321001 [Paramecium tetraurelia]CAK71842.1 unnamed protein product [Paramecium tetraurelia]|eukprot:XP_001439239.1 hypothetical protein (macronuclear) [Paramecium tetraurelia strain d4-2]